ncbi:MAG: SDR family NAD(P)-dependent oxidoreductase [Sphingobacteriales bacterium]|jgi:2-deoxy-D-gluconate 3-dehydrogenase
MSRFLINLKGKTAVVTGYNKGIGKAIAIGLAEAGANIIGLARSSGEEAADAIAKAGVKFTSYSVDFENRAELYATIEKIKASGKVDILINNAGMIYRKPVAEFPDEEWDRVLSVNLDAQFILTRELGKGMLEAGSGKIIFICSMLSYQGGINVAAYTASKSAVAGLVKAFANEWAGKGVHVNGIAPGYIATDNTKALQEDPVRSKSILERIPAQRWGQPEDLQGPSVFLASALSDYMHGTIINVDGGWMGR